MESRRVFFVAQLGWSQQLVYTLVKVDGATLQKVAISKGAMTNQYIGVAQSTFQMSKKYSPISPLGFGWWTPAWLAFLFWQHGWIMRIMYMCRKRAILTSKGIRFATKRMWRFKDTPSVEFLTTKSSPLAIYWNRTRDWQEHHRNHSVLNWNKQPINRWTIFRSPKKQYCMLKVFSMKLLNSCLAIKQGFDWTLVTCDVWV